MKKHMVQIDLNKLNNDELDMMIDYFYLKACVPNTHEFIRGIQALSFCFSAHSQLANGFLS